MKQLRGYRILPNNNNGNPNFELIRQLADGDYIYTFTQPGNPSGNSHDTTNIIAALISHGERLNTEVNV